MGRALKAAVASGALLGGLVAGNATAFGQTPSSGPIQVWVSSANSGNGGKILITGSIGDYGTSITTNSAGKASSNGDYKKLLLRKGTLLINVTQFNAAGDNTKPSVDSSNCSASFTFTAPVPIVSGTGDYSGATGTVSLTGSFAAILPKTKSGACNESSSAHPLSQFSSISGSGSVSF